MWFSNAHSTPAAFPTAIRLTVCGFLILKRFLKVLDEAEQLLSKITASGKDKRNFSIRWNGTKEEALTLARQTGLTGFQHGCGACELQLLNHIRNLAGYPPLHTEDRALQKRRMDICKGRNGNDRCEHYVGITSSCGPLIIGAINRKPGEPCGCYLPLKSSLPLEWAKKDPETWDCPLKKWPDE